MPNPSVFTDHKCHARGCNIVVQPRMFMCVRHWKTLPKAHQRKLWQLYRPGQEIDKNPSEAYLNHAMFCVNLVADLESGRK